jgi:hypothetical protein
VHWDFHCASNMAPPLCGRGEIIPRPIYGCRCTHELRPEDCEHTAQFQCERYEPVAYECRCDPAAPAEQNECNPPARFSCYEYLPPVGCSCVELIPIR